MAAVMEGVWESIFTAGPTPSLLIATNAAFAGLQLTLLLLLFFTRSIHFVVLSFLCAGLWWSINWFAAEVSIVQREKDEEARRTGALAEGGSDGVDLKTRRSDEAMAVTDDDDEATSAMDTGDDTETEIDDPTRSLRASTADVSSSVPARSSALATGTSQTSAGSGEGVTYNTSAAARLAPRSGSEDALRKRRSLGESSGYVSTDSEWEKVDNERG